MKFKWKITEEITLWRTAAILCNLTGKCMETKVVGNYLYYNYACDVLQLKEYAKKTGVVLKYKKL